MLQEAKKKDKKTQVQNTSDAPHHKSKTSQKIIKITVEGFQAFSRHPRQNSGLLDIYTHAYKHSCACVHILIINYTHHLSVYTLLGYFVLAKTDNSSSV